MPHSLGPTPSPEPRSMTLDEAVEKFRLAGYFVKARSLHGLLMGSQEYHPKDGRNPAMFTGECFWINEDPDDPGYVVQWGSGQVISMVLASDLDEVVRLILAHVPALQPLGAVV